MFVGGVRKPRKKPCQDLAVGREFCSASATQKQNYQRLHRNIRLSISCFS